MSLTALASWVQNLYKFFFIASNPSHRKFLAHIIPEMLSMDVMMLQVGLQVKQRHSNFTGRSYSIFSKVRLACKLIALQTCSIKGFFALSLNTKLFVTKCLGLSRTGYFGIEQVYDIYSSVNWNCALLMLKDNDKAKRKLHTLFFPCLDTNWQLIKDAEIEIKVFFTGESHSLRFTQTPLTC